MKMQHKHWLWIVVATATAFCVAPGAMAKQAGGGTITNSVTVNYEDANTTAYSANDSVDVAIVALYGVAWSDESAKRVLDAATQTTLVSNVVAATLTNTGNATDAGGGAGGADVAFALTSGANITGANFTYQYAEDFGPGGGPTLTAWTTGDDIDMYVHGIDETAGGGDGVVSGEGTATAVIQLFDTTGVSVNDMISINGTQYEITAVNVNQITVDDTANNLVAGAGNVAADGLVHQQVRFFVHTNTGVEHIGTLPTDGSDTHETHVWLWTATDQGGTGTPVLTTTNQLSIAVLGPVVSINKYARNLGPSGEAGSGGGGTCTSVTIGGNAYFADCTGANRVNTEPGDTIEYVVVVESGSGKTPSGATCGAGEAAENPTQLCASSAHQFRVSDPLANFTTPVSS